MNRKTIIDEFKNKEILKKKEFDNFKNRIINLSEESLIDFDLINNFTEFLNHSYKDYIDLLNNLLDKLTILKENMKMSLQNEILIKKIDHGVKKEGMKFYYKIDCENMYEDEIKSDLGYISYHNKLSKIENLTNKCKSEIINYEYLRSFT